VSTAQAAASFSRVADLFLQQQPLACIEKEGKHRMYSSMIPCRTMMMMMRPMQRMMSAACRPSTSLQMKREAQVAPVATFPRDLVDTALAAGSFNTLLSAVIASGLGETLKGSGPFTVFAPTDTAFSELPAGSVDDLLKPENRERLRYVLNFHVVPGRVTARDLANTQKLTMANGKELPFRVDISGNSGSDLRATLRAGTARLTKADIVCTNGVIHVIDRVLIPTD
jgi:uncharacterized surface protein with fasciclin (FAS1) repeats